MGEGTTKPAGMAVNPRGPLARVYPGSAEDQVAIRIKLAPAMLKVSNHRRNMPVAGAELEGHAAFFEAIARWVKEDPDIRLPELSKMANQDAVEIEAMFNAGKDGAEYFVDTVAFEE